MAWCQRCDNGRWVCEVHTDRPWEGARACDCGGAGAPCPDCNPSDEVTAPEMPDDFVADLNADDLPLPRETFIGKPERAATESEHFIKCPSCGGWIDCRDLGSVSDHAGPLPHPADDQLQ